MRSLRAKPITILQQLKPKRLIVFGILAPSVVLAAIWTIVNIVHEPQYGDTIEYWALSETLTLDSWRTIGYPLLLRSMTLIASMDVARVLLYLLQLAVTYIAALYFFRTLQLLHPGLLKDKWQLPFMALLLTASPLLVHFSLSTLTDSLATSLFVIACAAIGRLLFIGINDKLLIPIIVSSIFISCVIREDRILLFAVIICGALLYSAIRRQGIKTSLIIVALFLPLAAAVLVNDVSQQETSGSRPPLSYTALVFERTSRTVLADNLHRMPATIQQRIDSDLARNWKASQAYTPSVFNLLSDPAGHTAMRSAIKTSIQCCILQIGAEAAGDILEYIVAPVTYAKETVNASPDPTYWTNTRMGMFWPTLTNVYVWHSFLVMTTLIGTVAYGRFRRHIRFGSKHIFVVLIVVFVATTLALRTSLDFHIRYGLPVYMLELGLLIWYGMSALYSTPYSTPPKNIEPDLHSNGSQRQ